MEEIMQIGLISKRKHHFVLIDVSLSLNLTSYQIAIRLHWVWEICSWNVQNRVENLTFKFVPNWWVEHTKSAIIAIWLGKSFLPLLIYSQVASLSRASSLRKRSMIQGNGVSNLHSNKVFESFSFLNVFKLMVLITGRNQESVWLEDASSATQKCMVAEVNSHNLSINVISMIKFFVPACYACFYASSLLCNCSLCLWTMVRSCRLRVNMFAPICAVSHSHSML
jgi:hypothetical protein